MAQEFARPGYVLVGTTPLMMAESCNENAVSDDKMVKTLLLGLAGFSDGAQYVELDVKNAIPNTGLEYDAIKFSLLHQTQTLSFVIAGTITTVMGRVLSGSIETTVEAPSSMSFKFQGILVARGTL